VSRSYGVLTFVERGVLDGDSIKVRLKKVVAEISLDFELKQ
jgi:hypothetical protein